MSERETAFCHHLSADHSINRLCWWLVLQNAYFWQQKTSYFFHLPSSTHPSLLSRGKSIELECRCDNVHHLRLPSIQRLFLYRSEEKEKKTKEENVEFNDMRNEKVTEMFVHRIVYEIVNAGICMSRHVHNWHQIAKVFFSSSIFLCGISPRTLRRMYRF